METSKINRRRVSVSGMLKKLGVSRSGYRAFLNHKPSNMQQRKESVKKKIKSIYDDSKQNYGAPKITKELQKSGEIISERTVGKYMKEMGIRAQWVKPWTTTTRDSDFAKSYITFLTNSLILTDLMLSGVQISLIYPFLLLKTNLVMYAKKIMKVLIDHSSQTFMYSKKRNM